MTTFLLDDFENLKISSGDSDIESVESVEGTGMNRMFNPKKAVFTFGRFQPPTKGHGGLIKSIEENGRKLEAKPYVFVSLSQNALKDNEWKQAIRPAKNINDYITNKNNENPLSPDVKIEILEKMFPNTEIEFINGFLENPRVYSIQRAIVYLKEKGYTDISFIVGSKRFKQFKDLNFENKYTIKLIENKRILDGEMRDERLYELGKLTEEDIQEINNINPTNISGTKVRQLAAEHKVNMRDINQLTERQVRLRIEGGLVNKIRGHNIIKDKAFIELKKRMSNNLSDKDLEYYIYQIKKGLALNPFKTYRNQNKDLTRKSIRKGGKKRTRKKRGKGKKFIEGMVVAIEPMINQGTHKIKHHKDGWTITTLDNKPSAHFEHNIAIIDGKPELLSTFSYIYDALGIKSDEENEFINNSKF